MADVPGQVRIEADMEDMDEEIGDLYIPPHYSKEWVVAGHVTWDKLPVCQPLDTEVEETEDPLASILGRLADLQTRLDHLEREHGILPK